MSSHWRPTVAAIAAALLAAACGSDETAPERAWAERATLQVARVNDVVALEMLPAMIPGVDEQLVTPVEGPLDPDWEDLAASCEHLDEVLPAVLDVAESAPVALERAGRELASYHEALTRVVDGCEMAATDRDVARLELIRADFDQAGAHVAELADRLPRDIGCPADVPDRPESCDV